MIGDGRVTLLMRARVLEALAGRGFCELCQFLVVQVSYWV